MGEYRSWTVESMTLFRARLSTILGIQTPTTNSVQNAAQVACQMVPWRIRHDPKRTYRCQEETRAVSHGDGQGYGSVLRHL